MTACKQSRPVVVSQETQEPRCVFVNFSTEGEKEVMTFFKYSLISSTTIITIVCLFDLKVYSSDGCLVLWERGQSHVTCSCDHLTFFGVLLVGLDLLFTCVISEETKWLNMKCG